MASLQDNESPKIVIINIVTIIVAVAAVILRLISRRLSAAHFWWDDGLIVMGLFLSFGSSAFNFSGVFSTLSDLGIYADWEFVSCPLWCRKAYRSCPCSYAGQTRKSQVPFLEMIASDILSGHLWH